MLKVHSLILFCILAVNSFGHISRDILDDIKDCRLVYNQDSVVSGNLIRTTINLVLKDGSELSSEEGWFNPNLTDYNIEISGPVKILKRNRRYLWLKVDDDAYSNPFIEVKLQVKKKKTVKRTEHLRVRLDVAMSVEFYGADGYDPATSDEETRHQIFNSKFYISMGYQNTLSYHTGESVDGQKGPNLNVYVSLIKPEGFEDALLKVVIIEPDGRITNRYLNPEKGDLTISSIGGTGGTSRTGGKGGDGGDVTLFFTEEASQYQSQIFIRNFGGLGGPLWRPEHEGQIGPVGMPGLLEIKDWNGETTSPPQIQP